MIKKIYHSLFLSCIASVFGIFARCQQITAFVQFWQKFNVARFSIFFLLGNFPLNQFGLWGIYWEILKCCLKENNKVLKNQYHNAWVEMSWILSQKAGLAQSQMFSKGNYDCKTLITFERKVPKRSDASQNEQMQSI